MLFGQTLFYQRFGDLFTFSKSRTFEIQDNYYNPVGDKLFYTGEAYFNNHAKTEDGKLYYEMGRDNWVQVTSKILVGNLMFFNLEGY
jgi:hypothetical protein